MKVVSKDEANAHFREVVKGGAIGGAIGFGLGLAGLLAASRRWTAVRSLTLQFRSYVVTSTATFGAIVEAERHSLLFQRRMEGPRAELYRVDSSERSVREAQASESATRRVLDWARERRYTIVLASWVAAMAVAVAIVGRNRYLTTAQKVVQARVYAQGLTLLVLVASAGLEMRDARAGKGKWETVLVVDPNDPEHKHLIEKRIHHEDYQGQDLWKDMVEAEERRIAARQRAAAVTAAAAKNTPASSN
jgi:hypothetical protein